MSSKKCTDMYKCTTCDCDFASKYSLERHTVRKHVNKIDRVNGEIAQNCGNSTQNISNSTHFSGNLNQEESDDDYGFETELTHCPSCKKEFKRQWCLYRHIKTCRFKGDKYNCEYCNKNFKHSNSKYKHYKICKIKNRTGIVIEEPNEKNKEIQEHTTIQEQSIQNASVINNKNTIENQTNIENQNNTQNIIIVYNPDNMEFVTDKINYDIIQKLLQCRNIESKSQLVSDYGKEIFSIPENQCIKKNDLKSGHSEVHLGDKWEMKLDKHIYPKLACSVANNMSDYLNSKKDIVRHEIFNKTMKFLDYMSDEGYINTDDKEKAKQIKQEYKDLIRELRLIIHSKTDKNKNST